MTNVSLETAIGIINQRLDMRQQARMPALLNVGVVRPHIEVVSFEPLQYNRYGRWVNRAPEIAGQFALRTFLTTESVDGAFALVAGLEDPQTPNQGYGLGLEDPQTINKMVSGAAQQVGLSIGAISIEVQ
jgi:hypothetical protein